MAWNIHCSSEGRVALLSVVKVKGSGVFFGGGGFKRKGGPTVLPKFLSHPRPFPPSIPATPQEKNVPFLKKIYCNTKSRKSIADWRQTAVLYHAVHANKLEVQNRRKITREYGLKISLKSPLYFERGARLTEGFLWEWGRVNYDASWPP